MIDLLECGCRKAINTRFLAFSLNSIRFHVKPISNVNKLVVFASRLDTHFIRLDTHFIRLDTHFIRLDTHYVRLDTHRRGEDTPSRAYKWHRYAKICRNAALRRYSFLFGRRRISTYPIIRGCG
jgi:hypothetical protein